MKLRLSQRQMRRLGRLAGFARQLAFVVAPWVPLQLVGVDPALAKKNLQVTSNLVYVTTAKMGSRRRCKARKKAAQAAAANGQADPARSFERRRCWQPKLAGSAS